MAEITLTGQPEPTVNVTATKSEQSSFIKDIQSANAGSPASAIPPVAIDQQQASYRIVYADRNFIQPSHTAAYISVDERQTALIQLQVVPLSTRWRCVSTNKFDLCPI
ncbi:MAG: hypothetical protein R2932_26365 [Caldilineaceae bacterium]